MNAPKSSALPLIIVLQALWFFFTVPASAERIQSGETVIVKGCPGDKFAVTNSEGETSCFCQQGTTEVGDYCVSQDLADFFKNPWDTVCGYFGCGSGGGAPTPPEIDICDAENGNTCAEEFENCRLNNRSDIAICQSRKEARAKTNCDGNVWPNNSQFADWHRVQGYFCPNPDDDPSDANYWRYSYHGNQCQSVTNVHEQCMDAWLSDATSGSGGGISILGFGGSGSTGPEPAGQLAKARCVLEEEPKFNACMRRVEEELSCPADCDPAVSERIVLDPLRPDQRNNQTDGTTWAALVALNRQEQEHSLTRLGYLFLDRGYVDEAIGIFRVLVFNFPNSANARHSLGEALEQAGQPHLAEARYREALGVNRNFGVAKEDLSRLSDAPDRQ